MARFTRAEAAKAKADTKGGNAPSLHPFSCGGVNTLSGREAAAMTMEQEGGTRPTLKRWPMACGEREDQPGMSFGTPGLWECFPQKQKARLAHRCGTFPIPEHLASHVPGISTVHLPGSPSGFKFARRAEEHPAYLGILAREAAASPAGKPATRDVE